MEIQGEEKRSIQQDSTSRGYLSKEKHKTQHHFDKCVHSLATTYRVMLLRSPFKHSRSTQTQNISYYILESWSYWAGDQEIFYSLTP